MKQKAPLLLTGLFFILACSPDKSEDKTISLKEKVALNNPTELIGQWRFLNNRIIECYWEDERDYAQEWTYIYTPNRTDILFTKDSCFRIDMPVELREGTPYKANERILSVEGSLEQSRYIVKGDTLVLYRYGDLDYMKETFVRKPVNDSLINLLKRDTVNYAHFAGTWYIQREWSTGMGDGSYYTLDFPYTIPDSIVISREHLLATCYTNKEIRMRTNGVLRTYTYGYRSYRDFWDYDIGEFYLTPGDWYTGDSLEIHILR